MISKMLYRNPERNETDQVRINRPILAPVATPMLTAPTGTFKKKIYAFDGVTDAQEFHKRVKEQADRLAY